MARVKVDETTMGVHPFTIDWWRQLPEEFRKADRAQGSYLAPAWDGLNRDPRFVTGFDEWDRTNTSDKDPMIASVAFSRAFDVTPGVPVLVRSWHTPRRTDTGTLDKVTVTHTVRDYTGHVITRKTATVTTTQGTVDTWTTPDRFGRIHVTVDVAISVPYSMDALNALHVGTREVSFDELPTLEHFTVHKPYPLLRYMDGIGHQMGFLRDEARHLWAGDTVDPVTAPDAWLPFLAAMLGIPQAYTGTLTPAQLRAHLVAFMEQGRPPIGSRRAIAEVAKQWLTGDRQVTVLPANAMPSWPSPEDRALLQAVTGNPAAGRVILSAGAPVPATENRWEGTPDNSVSLAYRSGRLSAENRVPNPSFRTDLTNWTATAADLARDTATFETGAVSMRVTPTRGTGWYVITGYLTQPTYAYVRVRWRVFSATERRVHPKLWVYDPVSTTTADSVVVPAGEWTTVEGRFLVEADQRHRFALVPAATDTTTTPLYVDRVYAAREAYLSDEDFDGATADSSTNDVWVKPGATPAVYVWDQDKRWVTATGDHKARAQAVIDADKRQDRLHTILMLVRTDELPSRNLTTFAAFMNQSGVIPAGHRLVCLEARTTWDAWENAVGDTWDALEGRVRTWTADEAAGVDLDY